MSINKSEIFRSFLNFSNGNSKIATFLKQFLDNFDLKFTCISLHVSFINESLLSLLVFLSNSENSFNFSGIVLGIFLEIPGTQN